MTKIEQIQTEYTQSILSCRFVHINWFPFCNLVYVNVRLRNKIGQMLLRTCVSRVSLVLHRCLSSDVSAMTSTGIEHADAMKAVGRRRFCTRYPFFYRIAFREKVLEIKTYLKFILIYLHGRFTAGEKHKKSVSDYKVPEYHNGNIWTYYDVEVRYWFLGNSISPPLRRCRWQNNVCRSRRRDSRMSNVNRRRHRPRKPNRYARFELAMTFCK
jgi:hypothetical protein